MGNRHDKKDDADKVDGIDGAHLGVGQAQRHFHRLQDYGHDLPVRVVDRVQQRTDHQNERCPGTANLEFF